MSDNFTIKKMLTISKTARLVEQDVLPLLQEAQLDGYHLMSQVLIASFMGVPSDGRLTDALCRMSEKKLVVGYWVYPALGGNAGHGYVWGLYNVKSIIQVGATYDKDTVLW